MGMDIEDLVRLEIEGATAVRYDMIFVLVGFDRDAVHVHGKKVDGRRGVQRELVAPHEGGEAWIDRSERKDQIEGFNPQRSQDPVEIDQLETQELARKHKIFAQEVEAAEDPVVVRQQHLVVVEADLDQRACGQARDRQHGITEAVERADVNGGAIADEGFVERDRFGFVAGEMHRQFRDATAGDELVGLLESCDVVDLIADLCRRTTGQSHAETRLDVGRDLEAQGLQGSRGGQIFRMNEVEGPELDGRRQSVAACDFPVPLAVVRIDIGTSLDRPAFPQRRVAIRGRDPRHHGRGRRRKVVGHQLVQQVIGEFRELVFQLQLDPRRQIGRAFEQAEDHVVGTLFDQAAEPSRNAGELFGEFLGLLLQQAEFLIEQVEKFTVHRGVTGD